MIAADLRGVVVGFVGAAAVVLGITLSCKSAETAIIGGVDQACTVLDSQPEPSWVYFTCGVLDSAGNVLETYTVKVPKDLERDLQDEVRQGGSGRGL